MSINDYKNLITTNIDQLPQEEWRPIRGKFQRYWASNKGRVCSLVRNTPRILKQQENNSGYYRVCLSLEVGKAKYYLVHRIVAEAFLYNDNPEEKTTVHHQNERKDDNTTDNLCYLSLGDNIREHIKARAEKNGKK